MSTEVVQPNGHSTEQTNGKTNGHPVNTEELQYLDQIRMIMAKGSTRSDRTGTGTISIFGMQSRYSLRDCKFFERLDERRVY